MNKTLLSKRHIELENRIEAGISDVGKCLLEIHDSKSYNPQYETFEIFCKERFDYTDRHARRLIEAENVRVRIGHICPVSKLKTLHLSEIATIPAKKQAQVAASVIQACEEEKREPTAKDFRAAAKPFRDAEKAKAKPDTVDAFAVEDVTKTVAEPEQSIDESFAVEPVGVPKKQKPKKDAPVLTPKEQASAFKSKIKQYNAAMMRDIDELQKIAPNKAMFDIVYPCFLTIHETMNKWK